MTIAAPALATFRFDTRSRSCRRDYGSACTEFCTENKPRHADRCFTSGGAPCAPRSVFVAISRTFSKVSFQLWGMTSFAAEQTTPGVCGSSLVSPEIGSASFVDADKLAPSLTTTGIVAMLASRRPIESSPCNHPGPVIAHAGPLRTVITSSPKSFPPPYVPPRKVMASSFGSHGPAGVPAGLVGPAGAEAVDGPAELTSIGAEGALDSCIPGVMVVCDGETVDRARPAEEPLAQPALNTVTATPTTTKNRFRRPMPIATPEPSPSLHPNETHSSGEPLVV
jgi:hypothetical protein